MVKWLERYGHSFARRFLCIQILCKICYEADLGTAEGVSRAAQSSGISDSMSRKMLGLMNKRFDELNGMVIGLGQV
ncbi:MAG: hypothetical protein VYE46_08845, partial [Cyanobacteriota bacterium]|nr:hypothetical protein [Cyanobacteriota bacterium]